MLLTTLANAEAWANLGPPGTNSKLDADFGFLIGACSSAILAYLQRPTLVSQSVTEVRDGTGTDLLMLRHWPVSAVATVVVDNVAVPYAGLPVAGGGLP